MPLLFVVTLFASASLLFMVQPMVGRMVLPLLGGSPAVWNACMVFFQAILLVGYLYADRVTTRLEPKRQWLVHLFVLMLPVAAMGLAIALGSKHSPIAIAESLAPQDESNPIIGVLALLTIAIGIPFFVASTSAPLLQKWFAFTGHPSARDPYFLYAASNAGSLISLLGYPILIEPNLGLTQQAWLFGIGFTALIALIVLCGRAAANPTGRPPVATPKKARPVALQQPPVPVDEPKPTLARKLRWLALSFVPSSLMLGVTFYMTTDIASIPLLWVIPLALYLVTFIIAFGRVPAWFRLLIGNLAPVMILLLVFLITSGVNPGTGVTLLLHLLTFFAAALMCHYELARDRPTPKHLTNYYLWISLGGVLGGVFNALVAPLVFPLAFEYQITIVLACALVPNLDAGSQSEEMGVSKSEAKIIEAGFLAFLNPIVGAARYVMRVVDSIPYFRYILDILCPILMGGLLALMFYISTMPWFSDATMWVAGLFISDKDDTPTIVSTATTVRTIVVYALPIMLCFFFVERPIRFALCVAVILAYNEVRDLRKTIIHSERSFFGILKVEENGLQRKLVHGTTLHGTQYTDNHWSDQFQGIAMFSPWDSLVVNASQFLYPLKQQPLTYYHRTGPVGAMFRELYSRPGGKDAPYAMVGLGTGSVSCYGQPNQDVTFYEIDQSVIKLVGPDNPKYFTYTSDAVKRGAKLKFIVGDARLKLQQNNEKYGLLLVDAFSSDSIPVHLLTKEAVQMYMNHLTDDGFLALHISNKYVRLEPVVAEIAHELGLTAWVWNDDAEKRWPGKTASSWIVVAKDPKNLGSLVNPLGELMLDYNHGHMSIGRIIEDKYGADAAKKLEAADKAEGELDKKYEELATELAAKYGPVAGTLVKLSRKYSRNLPLHEAMVAEYGHAFRPVERLPGVNAWTDNYADVLQVMMIKEVQTLRSMFGIPTPVKE